MLGADIEVKVVISVALTVELVVICSCCYYNATSFSNKSWDGDNVALIKWGDIYIFEKVVGLVENLLILGNKGKEQK